MSDKDSFGLRLRAARERRGISLDSIAQRTKVPVSHWQEMERNDFSKWPAGLFARAYIRDYCTIVGLDPDETVDEFCRYFPQGDRRRENLIRGQADVVDIRSQYHEDLLPPDGDRRAVPEDSRRTVRPWTFPGGERGRRLAGASADVASVSVAAAAVAALLGVQFLPALGILSVGYHAVGSALVGSSPGIALVGLLDRRVPELVAPVERRRRQHA
jgi:transcriptional regulator with XRE-family HTH domain